MATSPAGSKPAPRKTTTKKPAAPTKKRAGFATPAKKPAGEIDSAQPLPELSLTAKQQRFVDEYLVDLNGTQAAIRAGYSPDTARFIGHENLTKPYIQLAIAEARKAQQERTQVDADRVVLEAWRIATADARELVQVKVGCCRYCWGEGHKRQRTLTEFNSDREQHRSKGKADEDWEDEGGIGYDPLRDPYANCPECHGDGHPRVVLGDTRKLTPQALALYAGAKVTKEGIEVKMHSKMDALEKLAKHLGLYEKDNQQKTDPLAALLTRISSGNGNGFAPVADDPERPISAKPAQPAPRDDDEG